MAILFKDRVKDASTTTGTGDFTLSGSAPTGFVAFGTAYPTGSTNQFYYCIVNGAEWEVGVSYLSASTKSGLAVRRCLLRLTRMQR
jgi:hypothetical protein